MFSWMDLPAIGTDGGLLLGVDTDVFDVLTWEVRDFSISCTLKIKSSGVTFRVINVYGSPYEEGKESFISELHSLFVDCDLMTLIGGDFNLVRFSTDKSNGKIITNGATSLMSG